MLVAKPITIVFIRNAEFENYVNYAGSKTLSVSGLVVFGFENYVNYAGSKTNSVSVSAQVGLRTM